MALVTLGLTKKSKFEEVGDQADLTSTKSIELFIFLITIGALVRIAAVNTFTQHCFWPVAVCWLGLGLQCCTCVQSCVSVHILVVRSVMIMIHFWLLQTCRKSRNTYLATIRTHKRAFYSYSGTFPDDSVWHLTCTFILKIYSCI